jgi:6,7-dimethyl-8-ribityllumazine synthase
MLKAIRKARARQTGGTFAIVASRYNGRYVDAMLRAAQAELKRAGATAKVVRVPGAFEIPAVASKLAAQTALAMAEVMAGLAGPNA